MKQHYSPVFYLRGFTDPAVKNRKKAPLWEFRFDRRTWEKARPEDIAFGEDFYSWTDSDGKRHDYADAGLQKIEDMAAPSIRKLVTGDRELDGADLINIAIFISSLRGRAPGPVASAEELVRRTGELQMRRASERLLTDPEELKRTIAGVKAEGADIPEDINPEALARALGELRVSVNRSAVASEALRVTTLQAPVLLEKVWGFLETQRPDFFIVSDSPFLLNTETMEATVPICRSLCLVLSHTATPAVGITTVRFRKVTGADEVRSINLKTAVNAAHFVAGPTLTFPGSDMFSVRSD